MNSTLSSSNIRRTVDEHVNEIISEMPKHIDRWGGVKDTLGNPMPDSMEQWLGSVDRLKTYADYRAAGVYKSAVKYYDLSGTSKVTISTNDSNGGVVRFNSLVLPSQQLPWTGEYFKKARERLLSRS